MYICGLFTYPNVLNGVVIWLKIQTHNTKVPGETGLESKKSLEKKKKPGRRRLESNRGCPVNPDCNETESKEHQEENKQKSPGMEV